MIERLVAASAEDDGRRRGLAGVHVPKTNRAVEGTCCKQTTDRRELGRADDMGVAFKGREMSARLDVPDVADAVKPCAGEQSPVGGNGHIDDGGGESIEASAWFASPCIDRDQLSILWIDDRLVVPDSK